MKTPMGLFSERFYRGANVSASLVQDEGRGVLSGSKKGSRWRPGTVGSLLC